MLAAVVAILVAVPAVLLGQGTPATGTARHAVAGWGTEQGLPSSIIHGIQQTPDGYVWLATFEGVVRFDGVRFRTFGDSDIPGLRRGAFVALVVDSAGALWAGSESGELVRRDGGAWTVFSARDGLPPDRITVLRADRDGGLWIGSRLGVWRMADGQAMQLPPPPGIGALGVVALAQDSTGVLWIGTVDDGLLRYDGRRYTRLTTHDGLPSDRIDALHVDPDGTVWVGFFGLGGVARVRDGEVAYVGGGDPGAPRRVRAFLRDRAGTLWLGADNGLFTLTDGRPVPAAGITTRVEALFQDAEGSVWVASLQEGLLRVREATFTTVSTDDGLPDAFVSAVDGDGRGGAWIGTQDGLVHRPALATATGSRVYSPATGTLPAHTVRDVLRDAAGDVWIATTGGLTRLPGGDAQRAVTYTRRDGLADDRVRALAAGRGGAVWIGTFDGVSEWRDGRLRAYGPEDGLTDGYILSVYEDRHGTLWVGTQSAGLFRRTPGGRFEPGPAALARQPIFRIGESGDGALWVGTVRGLARLQGTGAQTRVALVTTRHGLPGNTIFQPLDDGRGGLWLTGPWGIARVPLAELHAVADGRARTVTAKPFGHGDGLVSREASSISRSWRAPDGTLWFTTPRGVAVVDPAHIPDRPSTPRALVEQVAADGTVHEAEAWGAGALVLPRGTRTLEFRFTAPSFVSAEQLRFRYRLEGFEQEWQYGETRRTARYTNLPPASYRFVVQARRAEAAWDDAAAADQPLAATVRLRLQPQLWQSWWFLALVALAVGGTGLLTYRARLRTVARASALAAREEVLHAMSLRDDLTELYNRRGLLTLGEQQVRAAARDRRGFTLLFADLDGLKGINDTHGHAAGDRAIFDAAALLRETFREADIVARLGGDEFVVLLPDALDAPSADFAEVVQAVYARVEAALARHAATAGRPYRLSLSLGTSRYDPDAPRALEALLDEADRGMYAEKRQRQTTG